MNEKEETSVYKREFIHDLPQIKDVGFMNRSINRLATTKQPVNILNIEANHLKREIKHETNNIRPLLGIFSIFNSFIII
jgi:hypothetical protein